MVLAMAFIVAPPGQTCKTIGHSIPPKDGALTVPRAFCLSYVSRDLTEGCQEEIANILQRSQRNNERVGVGGFLAQFNGCFFQVLEGPQEAVLTLFKTISADPRHESIRVVWQSEQDRRRFRSWAMMHLKGWPRLFRTLAGPWGEHLVGLSITDPCWDAPDFAERMIEAAAQVHDFSVERQREILVNTLP